LGILFTQFLLFCHFQNLTSLNLELFPPQSNLNFKKDMIFFDISYYLLCALRDNKKIKPFWNITVIFLIEYCVIKSSRITNHSSLFHKPQPNHYPAWKYFRYKQFFYKNVLGRVEKVRQHQSARTDLLINESTRFWCSK